MMPLLFESRDWLVLVELIVLLIRLVLGADRQTDRQIDHPR
jgi:hypothetical protein